MPSLRATRIATMNAMLDGLFDSVEYDYVFEAAAKRLVAKRAQLRSDRAALSDWRRAEDCYLRSHGSLDHADCDWCNLGGSRHAEHNTYMRNRAVKVRNEALEVMRRRKWDTHGKTETPSET